MAYINGIGLLSPQKTFETEGFLTEVAETTGDYLRCIEPPSYRAYIDPIQSRRMSRLIKMGIAAAKISLADAGVSMPGAIITGTGLGSVDDTEKILSEISRDEKFLNPTPFIQSTYNTISSQVAIQLKCHQYNSTYVHRTFSFESGLTDALLQFEEGTADDILVGAIDEMTLNHLNITRRIGQWKRTPVSNLSILHSGTPGALAGEGAAFFTLSRGKNEHSYARLAGVSTQVAWSDRFSHSSWMDEFFSEAGVRRQDIDLVLLGFNGDSVHDPAYTRFAEECFPHTPWPGTSICAANTTRPRASECMRPPI